MESTSSGLPKIQTELIPDYIRENIGKTLFRRFMENIRDPEKLQHYNELGRAFMERWEREHPE